MGHNKLAGLMKSLSKAASLSQEYTNHCLRATVITRLSRCGVEARKIIKVTGHRNPNSIQSYIGSSTIEEKAELSSLLHTTAPPTTAASSHQSPVPAAVGAPPPPPPSLPTSSAIVPNVLGMHNNILDIAPHQVNNMVHNNLNTMPLFSGAVFSNTTININFNQ